jgi:hypothetical protein
MSKMFAAVGMGAGVACAEAVTAQTMVPIRERTGQLHLQLLESGFSIRLGVQFVETRQRREHAIGTQSCRQCHDIEIVLRSFRIAAASLEDLVADLLGRWQP